VAFAFALFAVSLLAIGTTLWSGEWLFGSMGWGVVHGTLFAGGVIVVAVGLILAEPTRSIARDAIVSVVIGIVVGIVFGMALTNAAWQRVTDAIAPTSIAPEWQLLAVAVGISAVVIGALGLIVGAARGGASGLFSGLVLGILLGAAIGAFTAISFSPQVGAALGVAAALLAFIVLQAVGIARRGVDPAALQARFYPTQTIDTLKETMEWLKAQTPAGR
jgi:hypothetical protein